MATLECACGAVVENVGPKAAHVTCWRCVARTVAPPDLKPTKQKASSEQKRVRITEDDKMEDAINSALQQRTKKKTMKTDNSNSTDSGASTPDEGVMQQPKRKRGRPKGALKGTANSANKPFAGFGRGWHLKKLFEHNGKFYSFGKEITAVEADALR